MKNAANTNSMSRPPVQGFLIRTLLLYTALHTYNIKHDRSIFTMRSLVVCLSVTLMDCDDIGWNFSKTISRLVSQGCSLSADPNLTGLLQGEQPKIFAQMGVWCRKKVILAYKSSNISETCGKIGARLLLLLMRTNSKS